MDNPTEQQRLAIKNRNKNLQIIACAGSGKTSTIVKRIISLISDGNSPESIVAITYTDKAAAALKQKVYQEFEKKFNTLEGLASMYIGTIHGYCLFLLHDFIHEYKGYDILNDIQTRLFIKRNKQKNGIYEINQYINSTHCYRNLAYQNMTSENFSRAVINYKRFLDIAREYGVNKLKRPILKNVIEKYEQTLNENKYFDYTSILLTTLKLMEDGKFDKYLEEKIKFLIVDEYQDVNDTQESIIKYIYNKGVQISVVGDDDQTIYNWRGSNLKYIKNFCDNYDNTEKIELDTNFRSSEGITTSANQVIINNFNRIDKNMKSSNEQSYEKGDILALDFETKAEEINFIINKIKQIKGNEFKRKNKIFGIDYDDMTILVRSVKHIDELIEALDKNEIEFVVEGTQNLFQTSEIMVLCDTFNFLFSLLEEPDSDYKSILKNIKIPVELINNWKKFTKNIDKEIEIAIKNFIIYFIEEDPYEYTIQKNLYGLLTDLMVINEQIDEKILYNFGKFTEMINDFEKIYLKFAPFYKIKAFESFLKQDAPFLYAEGWLSPSFSTTRCLRIMTFHQSKGLEFPVIFMPFLTKNAIFPMKTPGGTSEWSIINDEEIKNEFIDIESERRLFYVGMTRSEKYLFMSRSNVPYGNGKMHSTPTEYFTEAKNSDYVLQENCFDLDHKKSDEKKFSQDEVLTLNFSLLKDLFDCPYKFKLANIFGFKDSLDIRMGYGKSIHDMLDYVHKEYKNIPEFTDSLIEEIVDKYLNLPYASTILISATREKAIRKMKAYILNNKDKFSHIVFSEKNIDYKLNDYFFIDGRIDLIRNSNNNEITIVDFKSSELALSRDQIKNQLMIYVMGYENLTGENVSYIESYDFNQTQPTRLSISNSDRELFKKKLEKCQQVINSKDYKKAFEINNQIAKEHCKKIGCNHCDICYSKKI